MTIYEKGNFIYIKDCSQDFKWCDGILTASGAEQYFPLNSYTRRMFKDEILPGIRLGLVKISQELLDKIRTFEQNKTYDDVLDLYKRPKGITLKEHQEKAITLMSTYPRYGFFYGTGTGKTLIAITWLLNVRPSSCLIVTPQKVVGQYRSELDKYVPGNNYEVTNFEQLHHYEDKEYEALIVDESHRAKNYSSYINKRLRKISSKTKYCYIFTGSPMDKSRHEILPQLAILDERVMPVKVKIYERYFRINDFFTPEHEIRERSKELTEIIVAYTTGVKTEDVIDLPEENNYVIKCKVPPVAYDILLRDRVLYDDFDNKYVADSKALLRLGLKELCSGYLRMTSPDNKDVYIKFDNSLKIAKLTRLVANIPKGIIYYEFTNSIDDIVKVIHSVDKTCVVVNGETSAKKSTELINAFKKGEVDYLVIQSKSGNAGLDLTNVHDVIFYALPDSYIVFHQAKSRIRRIGQTQECNYYYLVCENSVERIIYDTLTKKKSFNDRIFAQYL